MFRCVVFCFLYRLSVLWSKVVLLVSSMILLFVSSFEFADEFEFHVVKCGFVGVSSFGFTLDDSFFDLLGVIESFNIKSSLTSNCVDKRSSLNFSIPVFLTLFT